MLRVHFPVALAIINFCKHFSFSPTRYTSSDCLASLNQSCSRGQPAGRLLELYTLAQSLVAVGGVCSPNADICSVQTAMNCITDLSIQVTLHDYTSSDDSAVCR